MCMTIFLCRRRGILETIDWSMDGNDQGWLSDKSLEEMEQWWGAPVSSMRVIREPARESILPPSVLIETTGIAVPFFWAETFKGNQSRIIIFHLKAKFKTLVTGLFGTFRNRSRDQRLA